MREHLDAIHEFMSIGQRTLRPRELNIRQIVEDLIKQHAQPLGDRSVRFEVGDLPPACGDLFLVKNLWSHLLWNAVKFTGNTETASVKVGAETSDGETVYFIRDNGVGFDMAEADRLFGMFKRLHSLSDFPGHGAGLACAKRIVNRHGGRIWGEGEVGKGATFRFTLPAS
jgi:light-regulated signal transduction histidine kinase (bacteriophytochrome)